MKIRYSILAAVSISFIVLVSCGIDTGLGVDSDPPQASNLSVEYTGNKDIGRANHTTEPIYLRNNPTSSSTASANVTTTGKGCQVTITWTQCSSEDFASYTLYRSTSSGISQDTTGADYMGTFTSDSSTKCIDGAVDWNTTYYYALITRDTQDLFAWSNEESITTNPALLPAGMEFVSIPLDSFWMGAPEGEQGSYPHERPIHVVTFDHDFDVMTTEVTQAMWLEVMSGNPSNFNGEPFNPVEMVSWDDCQDFVDAMNIRDPSHTYRLPSESEWEYCCRAGTTERFYWGFDPAETVVNEYAWWYENSDFTTHPVAQKLPNAWGLYDMGGNVHEWCEDWYHTSYDGAPSDGSAWLVPAGSSRVIRGGCWNFAAASCRSAYRYYYGAEDVSFNIGFRLARSVR